MSVKGFWEMNPVERYVYAAQMVRRGLKEWEQHMRLSPGGWRVEDADGNGPWWYIYEEGGKRFVTFRGQYDYKLIKEAITKWRR